MSPSPRSEPAADDKATAHPAQVLGAATRKTLQLADLLGGALGIDIDHNGHVYHLQITKTGKLILTK